MSKPTPEEFVDGLAALQQMHACRERLERWAAAAYSADAFLTGDTSVLAAIAGYTSELGVLVAEMRKVLDIGAASRESTASCLRAHLEQLNNIAAPLLMLEGGKNEQ